MLGSELITKQSFHDFLEKTFINKELAIVLLQCFYKSTKKANLDKVMFLLYNEYFPVDMLSAALSKLANGTENSTQSFELDVSNFENELGNIIDYCNRSFGVLYGTQDTDDVSQYGKNIFSHIKYDFFRNHVTTLTFKHYESVENFNEQLNVIYTALTENEKDFLEKYLLINSDNFSFLVRQQIDENKIDLAEVEKYDNSFGEHFNGYVKYSTIGSINDNRFNYYLLNDDKEYELFVGSNFEEKKDDLYIHTEIDGEHNKICVINENKPNVDLYSYFDITSDGYYTFDTDTGNLKKIDEYLLNDESKIIRNETDQCIYLLDGYRVVKDSEDIFGCSIYGRTSISNISAILNLTNFRELNYWYINNNSNNIYEKVASKRDMLLSILNKISLGTIHY